MLVSVDGGPVYRKNPHHALRTDKVARYEDNLDQCGSLANCAANWGLNVVSFSRKSSHDAWVAQAPVTLVARIGRWRQVFLAMHIGRVLGREAVADMSNEITAIPALLDALALEDCLMSIDALGCPNEIACPVERRADAWLRFGPNP